MRNPHSSFHLQGFINCLTAASPDLPRQETDDWRYTTDRLQPLVRIGQARAEGARGWQGWMERASRVWDPRMDSNKLKVS